MRYVRLWHHIPGMYLACTWQLPTRCVSYDVEPSLCRVRALSLRPVRARFHNRVLIPLIECNFAKHQYIRVSMR